MRRGLVAVSFCLCTSLSAADGPAAKAPALNTASIEALAKQILLDSLPAQFEEKKDWGKQIERPDLKFHGKGLNIRVEKRTKLVNHGPWRAYKVILIDPKERLLFRVVEAKALPNQKMSFQLRVEMPVKAEATVQNWNHGIKLLGMTAEAETRAVALIDGEVRVEIDNKNFFLPEMVLEPRVVAAHLSVQNFRLKRVGELEGALARELSGEAKRIVERTLHKDEAKLVESANKSIRKKYPTGKIKLSLLQLLP